MKRFLQKIVSVATGIVAWTIKETIFFVLTAEKHIINMKSKPKSELKKILGKTIVFVLSVIFLLTGLSILWFATTEIPDLNSFETRILAESTKIYDRTGKVLLYDLSQNMKRTVVSFDEVSPNIKKATLAIEDVDFYNHGAIKVSSIFRAFLNNLTSLGYAQGGSTITQQVVKNSLLTKDKTIARKIKEIILAIKLEKVLSKDEIFNLYLNEAPYGGTVYGVEEATLSFFGKKSSEVTLAEAAYIAAIPQAPTRYSPYGRYRDLLESRKNLVLSRMKEVGLITTGEYDDAIKEMVVFQDQVNRGIKAPHFVMFVKQYLEENYGDQLLNDGGFSVTTSLDYDMQKKAEDIVKKYALKNEKESDASNGGMVVMDPKTGDILAMVGSRDYFDKNIEGNYNVTTARRQPGSSFKPFIYAKAFSLGYTPDTVLFDAETQFSTNCKPSDFSDRDGCYSPQNYDGRFRGPINLKGALGGSINIPAVKLLYLVGVQNAIDLAKKMGITTLADSKQYGLTLVLGGGEVTLLDMTGAYSVFANDGVKQKTTSILKIEDRKGNVVEESKISDGDEVLSKNVALTVSDILSDNVARTPIFGANSSLYIPDRQVAVKTGTTNNFRDAWIVGYTPNIVVGAWNGNNNNRPINKKSAGMLVAPMWNEFMREILPNLPNEPFEKPEVVDTKDLKPILKGSWNTGAGVHSILYFIDKENPLGPSPKYPANDPQYNYWEYGVMRWLQSNGMSSGGQSNTQNNMSVSFIRPDNDDVVSMKNDLPILIKTMSSITVSKAEYYLNNKYLGSNSNPPYNYTLSPEKDGVSVGQNEIKVKVTDSAGNSTDSVVRFRVE